MRRFKVIESRPNSLPPIVHTYDGFNRNFHPMPKYLALANVDGEMEVWAVDDPTACELMRYFENRDGEVSISITYYKR